MTKIAINSRYGGFGLSRAAIRRLAELQGRECYFFTSRPGSHKYFLEEEVSSHELLAPEVHLIQRRVRALFVVAFDTDDVSTLNDLPEDARTDEQVQTSKKFWSEHVIRDRNIPRDDPLLIQVIEELGSDSASGDFASLQIVEIPDDVDWQIEEYDGFEWIAEKHRTWGA